MDVNVGYENKPVVDNITDWYQLFKGDNTDVQHQDTKKAPTALAELLLYSMQAKAYADFISGGMNSIEVDIKSDIVKDTIPSQSLDPLAGQVVAGQAPVQLQPLEGVVKNRQKIVENAEKLLETIRAIDSILSRVKLKEV